MTVPRSEKPSPTPPTDVEAEGTSVPGLASWRAVYACVLGGFVFYLIVLALITRAYAP